MKKYLIILIVIFIAIITLTGLCGILREPCKKFLEHAELTYVILKSGQVNRETGDTFQLQDLVAHAGGGIGKVRFVNSLEALNLSYSNGFRFIELDFEWTSDGRLVLIHDWGGSISELFGAPPRRYSLEEYKNLKMINGMANMSLDDLAKWIKQHPDAFIITDVKRDNIRALARIKEINPKLTKNIIPQIYHFYEYLPARDLGYTNIILTLYVTGYSDGAVLRFAKRYPLAAVTMAAGRALSDLPRRLKRLGVPTYAHTVNETSLRRELKANEVFGVYTDFLIP